MAVLKFMVDDKLVKKIDKLIEKGYFEDRAQFMLTAIKLLLHVFEKHDKEGKTTFTISLEEI